MLMSLPPVQKSRMSTERAQEVINNIMKTSLKGLSIHNLSEAQISELIEAREVIDPLYQQAEVYHA
jgi:hypothetical protein